MKIIISNRRNSNTQLMEKIKENLSKDAERNLENEAWMDKSGI